jgi:epoxyqueuosine reductase
MSAQDTGTGTGAELGLFVGSFIREFLAAPENNNLGPGTTEKAWDDVLVGFSNGDDELYGFFKEHIGAFHWTPAEAFALGSNPGRLATGGPATAGESPTPADTYPFDPRPDQLSVISWALCHTEKTKTANREQARFPSEPWARARIYGQACNRALHVALVEALAASGYPAVAPGLLPQWSNGRSAKYGRASTWSERHVAYVSGLGTFGLSGGLITERGQAVRLGSVVVRARIPPTPRRYADPFAYCLFFTRGICAACADRCPAGSISEEVRDKGACARHLEPVTADYVKREYGFDGYGCGLCQTKVPCESGIPVPLGESVS